MQNIRGDVKAVSCQTNNLPDDHHPDVSEGSAIE